MSELLKHLVLGGTFVLLIAGSALTRVKYLGAQVIGWISIILLLALSAGFALRGSFIAVLAFNWWGIVEFGLGAIGLFVCWLYVKKN